MRLLVSAHKRQNPQLVQLADQQFPMTTHLDPSFVCIAEVLKQVGCKTARLGKWDIGPDTQGFDLSSENGIVGPEPSFLGDPDVAEQLTNRALKFIDDNQNSPFFLFVSHWEVHVPLNARTAVVDKYRRKQAALPETDPLRFHPVYAVYAAMIEAVDTSVGRIVKQVDELGISESTLIIFTSDNGGAILSQLSPLRGMKGSLFEAGIRMPTCMRWTGTIKPGEKCKTPITSVDFLPTFSSLANAKMPTTQPVDGVDFPPLLTGPSIADRAIFWHFPLYLPDHGLDIDLPNNEKYSWRRFPSTVLRRGDWKLIEYLDNDTISLFNLKDDPSEANDLAIAMPDLAAKLRGELDMWQVPTNAPIPSMPNPECVLEN